ncbi:MAG TPA: hypothetical protein VFD71_14310 [Planctomycetota bacterium]|jgi:hypothetical protein|nr:hypothetical protein [Planctomycetota bacterium]
MLLPSKIQFQEISTTAAEFLHELNDPHLLRSQKIPVAAAVELRRHQILKLQENVQVLHRKRDEFNRKMDDYVHNLENLIRSLEKTNRSDSLQVKDGTLASERGTKVRCLQCDAEELFNDLQIIFARESDESMALPTQVYVLTEAGLKKGHFRCESCGSESLVIRAF